MAFIRIKRIRNKKTGTVYEYAYAVQNKWRKKGSRQKVKDYLGKVHRHRRVRELAFFDSLRVEEPEQYVQGLGKDSLIRLLVHWELARHGCADSFSVDFSKKRVMKDGKPASIAMNEGMLNTYTLRQLLNFKKSQDQKETGYRLAKAFVEAGIDVPQEVFITLFEKL